MRLYLKASYIDWLLIYQNLKAIQVNIYNIWLWNICKHWLKIHKQLYFKYCFQDKLICTTIISLLPKNFIIWLMLNFRNDLSKIFGILNKIWNILFKFSRYRIFSGKLKFLIKVYWCWTTNRIIISSLWNTNTVIFPKFFSLPKIG